MASSDWYIVSHSCKCGFHDKLQSSAAVSIFYYLPVQGWDYDENYH